MFQILLIISTILSGCCAKHKSVTEENSLPVVNIEQTQALLESVDSVEDSSIVSEDDSYKPRTYEEKWIDFKQRLASSQAEELVYYAEELYDALAPGDVVRRMELAFFIAQAYRKKGNSDKAKIFSQYYLDHLKIQQGGKSFRAHQENQSAVKKIMTKIGREGLGNDD